MAIKSVEAIYTGGNIWCFLGEFMDGTFFLASDCNDDVTVFNTDPRGNDEAWYSDWQEDHLIRYVPDKETRPIFEDIYRWLYENEPQCGLDFNYELSAERWM